MLFSSISTSPALAVEQLCSCFQMNKSLAAFTQIITHGSHVLTWLTVSFILRSNRNTILASTRI